MSLQALKLTKENLNTIAKTTGANPESLKILAANRDQYVLFETETLGTNNTWTTMSDVKFHQHLKFVEPETNRFIDVVTK